MTSLSSFQKSSKDAALAICAQGPATATKIQTAAAQNFSAKTLSEVTAQYSAASDPTKNDSLSASVAVAMDSVAAVLGDFRTLSQYVNLTVPKMEDGNNFGVTVQLSAVKLMTDASDSLNKHLDELSKYPSARADALEKCKIPGKSIATSTTESTSKSNGKSAEKGDVSSESTSTATETKTSSTTTESAELQWRLQALTQVDVMYYSKAKAAMDYALTSYLGVLDFVDKNAEKIAAPKGDSSSGPAYSSMY